MARIARDKTTLLRLVGKFAQHKRKRKLITPNGEQKYKTTIFWLTELRPHLLAIDADKLAIEQLSEHLLEAMEKRLGRKANPKTMLVYLAIIRAAMQWGISDLKLALPTWDLPKWGDGDQEESLPDPLTMLEITQVLAGFRDHYPHYYDYVYFLLSTACRPGEAASLTWDKVGDDFSDVTFDRSFSRGELRHKTKNKKPRTIVLASDVAELLRTRRENFPEGLIFTNPLGEPIHDAKFRRIWEKVLAIAGVRYRKPYSTRQTCISHALDSGAFPRDVAAAAGHSMEIMLRHYDRSLKKQNPFVQWSLRLPELSAGEH